MIIKVSLMGIFLTHAHIGHYTGLMHLGREAMGAKEVACLCYASYESIPGSKMAPGVNLNDLKNIAVDAPGK